MKKVMILLLSLAFYKGYAQTAEGNYGAAQFLLITPDARSAAMGGTGVGVASADNAIWHNAAASLYGKSKPRAVSYNYLPWLSELTSGYAMHSFSFMYRLGAKNALVLGGRYFKYPKIEAIPDGGNIKPKEFAIDLAYARELAKGFSVSITARYIHSDMGDIEAESYTHDAASFDFGAFYTRPIKAVVGASWSAGLRVGNMGNKLQYYGPKEKQPLEAKVGGSVDYPFNEVHKLSVALDVGRRLAPSDAAAFNAGIGAEYGIVGNYFIRGGYHIGDKDKGDESYGTVGAGVKFFNVNADFSYLIAKSDSMLKNTYWISVGFTF